MKRGPAPPPRGMTLQEIAEIEGCSVATVERILNRAVVKLKRREAFTLLLSCIRACTHSLLTAGSVECQGEWIEKNIGSLSYDDRYRLQNDGRTYSSCRTAGRSASLPGAADDVLDGQEQLRSGAVLQH